MGRSYAVTVTVASGDTDSAEQARPPDCYTLEVFAPAVLAEATTFTAAPATGGTFATLQSSGADISIAAGKAIIIQPAPSFMKVHLGGAAGDDRDFTFVWRQ